MSRLVQFGKFTLASILLVACIGQGRAVACETAGSQFVVVVDRQSLLGQSASYSVGDSTVYSINCAPPNSQILWSSTLNGVDTGEDFVYYGQNTDGNGHWSGAGGAWTSANLGNWTKTAAINGVSVQVAFAVTPSLTLNSPVSSINNTPTFSDGQVPQYTISGGPPNAPIYWSSTRNGMDTGEDFVYYGQNTDGNGFWTSPGGAWSSGMEGAWTKTAYVGNTSNPGVTVNFQVIASCDLLPPSGTISGWNNFNAHAGAYDWPINRCLIDDGANKMSAIGAHVLHMLYSADCGSQEGLDTMLDDPEISQALSNTNITTFVLTVFDKTTCANSATSYVDPNAYPNPNVVADYQNLTMQLYSRFQGTGRTFIISNWEGDNVVYCGYAYGYASTTDARFRAACDANYSALYKGVPNAGAGLSGFTSWLQARQQGIQAGQSWAASMGLTGVTVNYAVEFNIVHALQGTATTDQVSCPFNAPYQSTLCNVLPVVPHDYVSYSAYESTNISSGQLVNDLSSLRDNVLGNSNIIIGEFGYSEREFSQQQVRQLTDAVFNAAINWGVPYIFQWVVFDNDEFGLYDFAGQDQATGCYFEIRLPGGSYPSGSCN